MEKLSEFIKRKRTEKGISQRKLAKDLGLDNSYIAKIENGSTKKPSPEVILHMGTYLGVDFLQLLEIAGYSKTEIYEMTKMGHLIEFSQKADKIVGHNNIKKYTVENASGLWLDIGKILDNYKSGNLSIENTVKLINLCNPVSGENEDCYFTEKYGNIIIEHDLFDDNDDEY